MKITVIPSDNFMSKDGVGLFFDFSAIRGIQSVHAIQWDEDHGHIERTGYPNDEFTNVGVLAPLLAAYDAEIARLEAVTAAELAFYNSAVEVIKRKFAEVNAVRESKIAAGIPFHFSDGPGTIQTRDFTDIRNIQTIVTFALILHSQGETKPVMVFRDMEDTLHQMTPAQALEMGIYVAQHGQKIYNKSWKLKDLGKILTVEELTAFNVEENWEK